MSSISELDGTELYYHLLNHRIVQWERADPRSRTEHEAAEGFTRAWAEMDAALKDGGTLPAIWAGAKPPQDGKDETVVNWPEDARKLRDYDTLRRDNAELKAEVASLKAQLDQAERRTVLLVPAVHMPEAMQHAISEPDGTVLRASDDPAIEFELKAGTWHPRS